MNDHTPRSSDQDDDASRDPARAWATEHYGFAEDPVAERPAGTRSTATTTATSRWTGSRRLVAAAVLSVGLVAGVAGTAAAVDSMDPGGPDAAGQGLDGDRDGGRGDGRGDGGDGQGGRR